MLYVFSARRGGEVKRWLACSWRAGLAALSRGTRREGAGRRAARVRRSGQPAVLARGRQRLREPHRALLAHDLGLRCSTPGCRTGAASCARPWARPVRRDHRRAGRLRAHAGTRAPYYRSSYVWVQRAAPARARRPRLRRSAAAALRIGVQLIGNDMARRRRASRWRGTRPARVVGFPMIGEQPAARASCRRWRRGRARRRLVWGPQAGYFAQRAAVPLRVAAARAAADLPRAALRLRHRDGRAARRRRLRALDEARCAAARRHRCASWPSTACRGSGAGHEARPGWCAACSPARARRLRAREARLLHAGQQQHARRIGAAPEPNQPGVALGGGVQEAGQQHQHVRRQRLRREPGQAPVPLVQLQRLPCQRRRRHRPAADGRRVALRQRAGAGVPEHRAGPAQRHALVRRPHPRRPGLADRRLRALHGRPAAQGRRAVAPTRMYQGEPENARAAAAAAGAMPADQPTGGARDEAQPAPGAAAGGG
jgi:hypothetical protein